MLPQPIIDASSKIRTIPGVGSRGSQKLALDILQMSDLDWQELSQAFSTLRENVGFCSNCGYFAEKSYNSLCPICADTSRKSYQICLVERPVDIISVERSNIYFGRYHVLEQLISPLDNIFPEDTKIGELFDKRLYSLYNENPDTHIELILFFKPGFAGEATTAYIKELIKSKGLHISVTRLAQGLPMYYNTDTLDQATITKAFEDRREV